METETNLLTQRRAIAVMLFLSGALLSSLVPGGPVETRDFSHIHAGILLGFNIYLTILGLGSFIWMVYVYRGVKYSGEISLIISASYLLVYGIDLLGIFPKSPSEMSKVLLGVEVTGMLIALLMICPSLTVRKLGNNTEAPPISSHHLAVLLIIGLIIIAFSTYSAMG